MSGGATRVNGRERRSGGISPAHVIQSKAHCALERATSWEKTAGRLAQDAFQPRAMPQVGSPAEAALRQRVTDRMLLSGRGKGKRQRLPP